MVASELKIVSPASLKEAVRRLERDPECGKPLGGKLAGCRSIRVEGSENRIVYRVRTKGSNGATDVEVEIIAIGRRRDDAVYDTAEKRV